MQHGDQLGEKPILAGGWEGMVREGPWGLQGLARWGRWTRDGEKSTVRSQS